MSNSSRSTGEDLCGDAKGRSQRAAVAKAPCKSCPYRRDVPSGLWASDEYDKLPGYDGEIMEQLSAGAVGLFFCHQQDGRLCAGWVATHGANNLLACRLHGATVHPDVWSYQSPVAVFQSGAQASEHGKRAIRSPDAAAKRAISRLVIKAARRDGALGRQDGPLSNPGMQKKSVL